MKRRIFKSTKPVRAFMFIQENGKEEIRWLIGDLPPGEYELSARDGELSVTRWDKDEKWGA